MYYREKLINGVWHYKTCPKGKWEPMTVIQLTNKISRITKLADKAYDKGYNDGANEASTQILGSI